MISSHCDAGLGNSLTLRPHIQVDNLNTGQLNVGIWSGDVKLRNLRLKKEALDKFRLPVDVVEGYLGDLTLSIPW